MILQKTTKKICNSRKTLVLKEELLKTTNMRSWEFYMTMHMTIFSHNADSQVLLVAAVVQLWLAISNYGFQSELPIE